MNKIFKGKWYYSALAIGSLLLLLGFYYRLKTLLPYQDSTPVLAQKWLLYHSPDERLMARGFIVTLLSIGFIVAIKIYKHHTRQFLFS